MRKITDEEVVEHYKKYVVDAIIADGKDPKEMMIVKLTLPEERMSIDEVYKHLKKDVKEKKVMKSFIKDELRIHKNYMKYLIKKGKMK